MARARVKVGLGDIAREVDLSKTTVSYALRGKQDQVNLAPETVEKIHEAAKRLGYRPNYWARALVSKKTKSVGVLFNDLTGSSAHEITKGIQDVLGLHDYETMLAVSFWQEDKFRKELKLMLEKRVDGIIAAPQPNCEDSYKLAADEGVPVVFISDYPPSNVMPSVALDPEDAVYKLLNHLHQLGHRDIGLLSVAYNSPVLLERERAFECGLEKLGLECKSNWIYRAELANEISVYENVRNLIRQQHRPSALVCVSDPVAMQTLGELARLEVAVPEDLAVAGIGNVDGSDHPFFSLTTVDECRVELGREAARILIRQQESSDDTDNYGPQNVRVKGPLITRASTVGAGLRPKR
ncbi:MAG: LacI family DNA-binding transcriptional regulator [Sedimentisphaerales bacterium]|nr:LacI family DNA-binding transcriptional regulator [Sedimentisphaerales bacterium]